MNRSNLAARPAFLWQGALIVLPVLLLATLGLMSIGQDRRLAEQDARDRAQSFAQDLAQLLSRELWINPASSPIPGLENRAFSLPAHLVFQLNDRGELLFPPPCPPLANPQPLDLAALNAEQLRFWEAAEATSNAGRDRPATAEAYRQFLAREPPERFAAAARYSVGLALAESDDPTEACDSFERILQRHCRTLTEGGVPLAQLARWQLLLIRWQTTPNSIRRKLLLADFGSNVVFQPSPLTPWLLDQALQLAKSTTTSTDRATSLASIIDDWTRLARSHERARQLRLAVDAAGASLSATTSKQPPTPLWIFMDGLWLVYRAAAPGATFVGQPESDVRKAVQHGIDAAGALPGYFALSIRIAGRPIVTCSTNMAVLATASTEPTDASPNEPRALSVAVHLADPHALYARQRWRSSWLAALITAASVAAFAGLATAYRAFSRQFMLSEMKSNFVASVSHELRAPIASVRLLAESLERGKVPEESRRSEYFRLIVQECRRLSSLIENVLDFSRIDQGRKRYHFESTDLAQVVEQTARLMAPYAQEQRVRLVVVVPPNGVVWVADSTALRQALINLVDNAVKHSPAGGIVTVGLEAEAALSGQPGRSVETENGQSAGHTLGADATPAAGQLTTRAKLWVEDHGPGIALEEQDRLFEPFFRRGSELRRETTGIGIGLSIVKHVVEAHGGQVEVVSQTGQGCRFTIELPQRAVSPDNKPSLGLA